MFMISRNSGTCITRKPELVPLFLNVNLFVVTKMEVYVGDNAHGTERRLKDKLFIR